MKASRPSFKTALAVATAALASLLWLLYALYDAKNIRNVEETRTSNSTPTPPRIEPPKPRNPAASQEDDDRPTAARRTEIAAATRDVVREVVDLLHAELQDADRFPELAACDAQGPEPKCTELRAEAMRHALRYPVAPALATGKLGIRELLGTHGKALPASARNLAFEALEGENDPVARIAWLALADTMATQPGALAEPLPENVFQGLTRRNELEISMLLTEYRSAPPAGDVSDAILQVALDEERSGAVRADAVASLATHGESEVIAHGISALPVLEPRASLALGAQLARCADRCGETITTLASSREPSRRLVALSALGHMPAPSRRALVTAVENALPTGELTHAERDQLRYLRKL